MYAYSWKYLQMYANLCDTYVDTQLCSTGSGQMYAYSCKYLQMYANLCKFVRFMLILNYVKQVLAVQIYLHYANICRCMQIYANLCKCPGHLLIPPYYKLPNVQLFPSNERKLLVNNIFYLPYHWLCFLPGHSSGKTGCCAIC